MYKIMLCIIVKTMKMIIMINVNNIELRISENPIDFNMSI